MIRLLVATFNVLLIALPREFRRAYGASMRRDFSDELSAGSGAITALVYAARAYGDVLVAALDERTADLRRDLAYSARSIRQAPGFALVVIGTLALAIGANTAVFSVLHGVVLAPLPYDDADRLVVLHGLKDGQPFAFSLPDFADLHAGAKTLAVAAVAMEHAESHVLDSRGTPYSVTLATASAAFFDVFKVKPMLGRFFTERDARPGSATTIVIANGSGANTSRPTHTSSVRSSSSKTNRFA